MSLRAKVPSDQSQPPRPAQPSWGRLLKGQTRGRKEAAGASAASLGLPLVSLPLQGRRRSNHRGTECPTPTGKYRSWSPTTSPTGRGSEGPKGGQDLLDQAEREDKSTDGLRTLASAWGLRPEPQPVSPPKPRLRARDPDQGGQSLTPTTGRKSCHVWRAEARLQGRHQGLLQRR